MSSFSKGYWKTLGGIAAGVTVAILFPPAAAVIGSVITSVGATVGGVVAAAGERSYRQLYCRSWKLHNRIRFSSDFKISVKAYNQKGVEKIIV